MLFLEKVTYGQGLSQCQQKVKLLDFVSHLKGYECLDDVGLVGWALLEVDY